MAHGIAACSCGGSLFVAYLAAGPGNTNQLIALQQTQDGVWQAPVALGIPDNDVSGLNAVPPPLKSVVGVENWFIVLDGFGVLYAISPPGNPFFNPANQRWSDYIELPMVSFPNEAPQVVVVDFAVASLEQQGIVVAAIDDNYQVWMWFGIPQTNPLQINGLPGAWPLTTAWSQAGGAALGKIGIDQISVAYTAGSIVVLAITDETNPGNPTPPTLQIWSQVPIFEGLYPWNPDLGFVGFEEFNQAALPAGGLFPALVGPNALSGGILASGNPNGTLQAILLPSNAFGQPGGPILVWDSSGDGTAWSLYINVHLLPANVINPPSFVSVAAGTGNAGYLQVVGLGHGVYPPSLPYLIYQDDNGNWFPFPYSNDGEYVDLANGFPGGGIYPVDLAIGMGYGPNAQQYLQVAYLGSDGGIYLSYQDTNGTWHWYAGRNGAGLP